MKEKLKTIQTIHIALVSGLILAYVFAGDLLHLKFFNFPEIETATIPYLVIPLGAIYMGNILYKKQLKSADKKLPLEDKIGMYQTASIIRWALVEGPAFLILFLAPEFILVGLILIVYLAFLRPSEDGMKRDFDSIL